MTYYWQTILIFILCDIRCQTTEEKMFLGFRVFEREILLTEFIWAYLCTNLAREILNSNNLFRCHF